MPGEWCRRARSGRSPTPSPTSWASLRTCSKGGWKGSAATNGPQHRSPAAVGRSLGEICDEWERLAPAIERFCINDAFFGLRINADAVCHLHDIYSAVGRVGDRSSLGVRAALERYGPLCVERIAGYAADPADPLPERTVLALDADGQRYVSGGSAPSATLRASPFELLRAISGRRSRRQIEAMDWTGDPSPLIDRLSVYGMPSQDVVEPAAG